jgi:two-component system chemotaxis response regulator CheB
MQMPGKNGQQALEEMLQIAPTPVIMVSSLTQRAADVTMAALDAGAIDYLGKPSSAKELETVLHDELIKKIRACAWTDVRRVIQIRHNRKIRSTDKPRVVASQTPRASGEFDKSCIAIGISTGGPPALTYLFECLAPPLPPIVVVQHMPQQFTGAFAQRLDKQSQLSIKEAATGDILQPDHVYVAPGGQHMHLVKRGPRVEILIEDGDPVAGHKPSVDVMMKCAAKIYGERCLGVIMTGMGRDGADGCRAIKAAGGYTLGQDQASSDVYGMNKVAFTEGSIHEQFGLDDGPSVIVESLSKLRRGAALAASV